tara:strand:- start:389 stop:733 length:345 start_codon:yes stop_codon:yes gene_type:complete
MDYNKIFIAWIIFVFSNIVIWYQVNGQLVWEFWKSPKGIVLSCLMGIPISALFLICTKLGYDGFGTLWPVRFLGFATSMMTFPIMTWLYLGETITLKTTVSIILSLVIIIVQIL